jgi:S1-C subfamily serine protease
MHSWRPGLACVVVSLFATPALPGRAQSSAQGSSSAQASTKLQTFVVESIIGDGRAAIGSGVVVAREGDVLTLVTAAHVLHNGSPLRILDTSRRSYYDVVGIRVLPEHDLALVRVEAQLQSPPEQATFAKPTAGEPVWVWGNPGDSFWSISTGRVVNTAAHLPRKDGAARFTIACDACSFGDSGSGVFNSQGQLLGVLTAGWKEPGGPVLFQEVQSVSAFEDAIAAFR